MMKTDLSIRMKMNASLVDDGAKVADIGCDHGYVAIWLATQKKCKKVIASDIGEGPLNIARKNILKAELSDVIELRNGDGLSVLKPGEVDTVLIAGMGGMLICNILSSGVEILNDTENLILQPQSDVEAVRRHIHKVGYRITNESVCIDGGKYYFSIKAKKGEEETPYTDTEYRHSRILSNEGGSVYRRYIKDVLNKYSDVLKSITELGSDHISDKTISREEELLKEIEDMRRLL